MFQAVNADHQVLCSSREWMDHLRDEVLSPLLTGVELGEHMLELGPGAGAATEVLRRQVPRLTALELDAAAARALEERFAGTNVTAMRGDCARTGLPGGSFDSVGCFTMLHHVATDREQHATLAEAFRVLRPGGVLIGSDSVASNDLHHFHADDIYNPVEPAWLVIQLLTLGFRPIGIRVGDEMTFTAHKPRNSTPEVER